MPEPSSATASDSAAMKARSTYALAVALALAPGAAALSAAPPVDWEELVVFVCAVLADPKEDATYTYEYRVHLAPFECDNRVEIYVRFTPGWDFEIARLDGDGGGPRKQSQSIEILIDDRFETLPAGKGRDSMHFYYRSACEWLPELLAILRFADTTVAFNLGQAVVGVLAAQAQSHGVDASFVTDPARDLLKTAASAEKIDFTSEAAGASPPTPEVPAPDVGFTVPYEALTAGVGTDVAPSEAEASPPQVDASGSGSGHDFAAPAMEGDLPTRGIARAPQSENTLTASGTTVTTHVDGSNTDDAVREVLSPLDEPSASQLAHGERRFGERQSPSAPAPEPGTDPLSLSRWAVPEERPQHVDSAKPSRGRALETAASESEVPARVSAPRFAPAFLIAFAAALAIAVALYHRLTRKDVLAQEARARILAVVQGSAGLTASKIAAAAAVYRTTAEYHLKVLVTSGLIVEKRMGNRSRYFAPGAAPAESPLDFAAPVGRDLANLVAANPGLTMGEAAAALGVGPMTVTYHAKRLSERSFLTIVVEGSKRRLFAAKPSSESDAMSPA